MKASEVIELLKQGIERDGDVPVRVWDDGNTVPFCGLSRVIGEGEKVIYFVCEEAEGMSDPA